MTADVENGRMLANPCDNISIGESSVKWELFSDVAAEAMEQFAREGSETRAERQHTADLIASVVESARALRGALHAEPQPPCEQYQCANTRHCAVNRLLCGSFYRYATEHDSPVEQPTKPTANYYRRLYGRK